MPGTHDNGSEGRLMAKLDEVLDKLTTLTERVETLASESEDPARQVPGPEPDAGVSTPSRPGRSSTQDSTATTPKPAKY
jgi:hypothetical protein